VCTLLRTQYALHPFGVWPVAFSMASDIVFDKPALFTRAQIVARGPGPAVCVENRANFLSSRARPGPSVAHSAVSGHGSDSP
jgi:hypothetical protein